MAPRVQILSTTPTYKYDEPDRNYAAWDGTSMAAPHVAAAAALVLARHPGSTPAQVIKRLTSSADREGPEEGQFRLRAGAQLRGRPGVKRAAAARALNSSSRWTSRANDLVYVREVLGAVRDLASASVEEVVPGVRSGSSAGLLCVRLNCEPGSKAHRSSARALRGDGAVVYVEEPKPRRPL
jgi:subtilisin family serine protease